MDQVNSLKAAQLISLQLGLLLAGEPSEHLPKPLTLTHLNPDGN